MSEYWNNRYERGVKYAGSMNELGAFKIEVVQQIINELDIKSIIDIGCGAPALLEAVDVEKYVGAEASEVALSRLGEGFKHIKKLRKSDTCEMSVSLDIVQFLDDEALADHIATLGKYSSKYVLIYAPNRTGAGLPLADHMHFREFVPELLKKMPWSLEKIIQNRYPAAGIVSSKTSFSTFHLFTNNASNLRNSRAKKRGV